MSTAPSDLVAEAQDLGYEYVNSADGLAAAEGDRLLGLFANEEMFQQRPEGEGDEYSPVVPLADMTTKALDALDESRDGFFLVVEEEAVDEMSHENNGTRMLQAMRALEDAVQVARDYVAQHPDTLLIVTGDHECGGLTVEGVDDADESGDGTTISAEDGSPWQAATASRSSSTGRRRVTRVCRPSSPPRVKAVRRSRAIPRTPACTR